MHNYSESSQYYTNASHKAVHQMQILGNDLLARPDREKQHILHGIAQMVDIGQYFGQAITHQEECNRKVAAAMKATNDIARQVESSAKSVNDATTVLDQVVNQLRQSDCLLPAKRRLRSYPRVIKTASTRFFVKQDKDVPFLFPDQTKAWKDFVCPLHSSETRLEVLLI